MKYVILIVLCFISFLSGCDESYSVKTDYSKVGINSDVNDFKSFIKEIYKHAHSYDDQLILGEIQLTYDEDLKIELIFTKAIDENKSKSLFVTYSETEKSIISTECMEGASKVFSPYDKELNYYNWKINFEQGLKYALLQRNIIKYKRVSCVCYSNSWHYIIFENDDYSNTEEVIIDPVELPSLSISELYT